MAWSTVWGVLALVSAVQATITATVHVDGSSVLSRTAPHYVSFNFDWHLNNEETPAWINSSVLVLPLQNKQLLMLAQELSPALLRVGGSEGDVAVYDMGQHIPVMRYQNKSWTCPGSFCLTKQRWQAILQFCTSAKCGVVFGLNALTGRGGRPPLNASAPWDHTNAAALMQYTSTLDHQSLFGFELGNELQNNLHAAQMAQQYVTARELINKYFVGQDPQDRPQLIGPDENPDASWLGEFLDVAKNALNATTYHLYPGYGLDPKLPEEIATASFLNKSADTARPILQVVQQHASKNVQLWVGETAAAWHSGQNFTTNAFVSSFWYIDQLGSLAQMGHSVQCRQTLVGGYYELIDKFSLTPNPDYYVAWLWKRVLGTRVLAVKNDPESPSLRLYAHCVPSTSLFAGKGAVGVAAININATQSVSIDFKSVGAVFSGERHEYHLTSTNLRSRSSYLNGEKLVLQDGRLPSMQPRVVPAGSGPLTLAASSQVFVVFPHAQAGACA